MHKELTLFSLATHQGPYAQWPGKTRLFHDGRATNTDIPGHIIEAQFAVNHYYLIITSQDRLFEDSNDFTLLDKNFTIIAHACVARMYNSFLLDKYRWLSEYEIIVKYRGDIYYKISLSPTAHRLFATKIGIRRCTGFDS